MVDKYSVTPVNRRGNKIGGTKEAKGSAQIRPEKKAIRRAMNKKRQKFDVFNKNKHRFVDH